MKNIIFLAIIATVHGAISAPKKYESEGTFLASFPRYTEPVKNTTGIESKASEEDDVRTQRFGISGYGSTGMLYPQSSTGIGSFPPLKIDLGGIVLGTLIGLGAFLIVPKLSYIFSGGYKRSIENEMESVTDMLSRIDKALEDHHIDSSTCVQRLVCSYVQAAQKNSLSGDSSTMDEMINTLAGNSMLSFLLDGTVIQQAIKIGKQADPGSCSSLHTKCPVNKENVIQLISNLLPA